MQTKLRNELTYHGIDPTYDQLTNGLPYLDAVVHEILRIHPPIVEFTRVVCPRLLSPPPLLPDNHLSSISLSDVFAAPLMTDDHTTLPQAIEDDVIPISEPVRTKSGELVDSLTIAKGTLVAISMESMNRSAAVWGDDAKVFRPSRWLEDANGQNGIPAKAKEIQGHRHLLTFVDGPRTCLGKNFALAELKVCGCIVGWSLILTALFGRRC